MATAVGGADSTRCEVGMMVGVGVLSMAASGSAQMAEGGPWGVRSAWSFQRGHTRLIPDLKRNPGVGVKIRMYCRSGFYGILCAA